MLVEFDNLNTSVQLLANLVLVYKIHWQPYAVRSVRVDIFDLKRMLGDRKYSQDLGNGFPLFVFSLVFKLN